MVRWRQTTRKSLVKPSGCYPPLMSDFPLPDVNNPRLSDWIRLISSTRELFQLYRDDPSRPVSSKTILTASLEGLSTTNTQLFNTIQHVYLTNTITKSSSCPFTKRILILSVKNSLPEFSVNRITNPSSWRIWMIIQSSTFPSSAGKKPYYSNEITQVYRDNRDVEICNRLVDKVIAEAKLRNHKTIPVPSQNRSKPLQTVFQTAPNYL